MGLPLVDTRMYIHRYPFLSQDGIVFVDKATFDVWSEGSFAQEFQGTLDATQQEICQKARFRLVGCMCAKICMSSVSLSVHVFAAKLNRILALVIVGHCFFLFKLSSTLRVGGFTCMPLRGPLWAQMYLCILQSYLPS